MQRPKPTNKLVLEITGGKNNYHLRQCLYEGLNECPSLKKIYPYLDFDELIVFAASSLKTREENPKELAEFIRDLEKNKEADEEKKEVLHLYRIFGKVYHIGMQWLDKNKNISDKLITLHNEINPFNRRNLRERLHQASLYDAAKLKRELIKPIQEDVYKRHTPDIMKILLEYPTEHIKLPEFGEFIEPIGKQRELFQ